jgi:pyridoxamine 5'-phosphate oxidase family protein
MSAFTTAEIEYLRGRPLARLATVGADGRPQVKPVGFLLDLDSDELVIGGYAGSGMAASKKFRDVRATRTVALVVDDVAEADPWILVSPTRIVSWGIDCSSYEVSARDVALRAGTGVA